MQSQTPLVSIVLFVFASLLGAFGQFLYKSGADAADGGLWSWVLNLRILGGLICYVAVMVCFLAAFKKGGELSVLYPIYATTFIWAAVISYFSFQTPIRPVHVGGMCLLILGM